MNTPRTTSTRPHALLSAALAASLPEQALRTALLQGLRDRRDTAVAHKYLAFIACAFNRLPECERQFRNALAVDPGFVLTDAEIGHPIWGPVYRRVAGQPRR